jgi:hypothetical protein
MSGQKRRTRRGKPGSLGDLQRELWGALRAASALLDHETPELRLRAVHATAQAAAVYRAALADSELDQRLSALEEIAAARR